MSSNLQTRIEAGDLHFLDGLVLLGTIASQRWFGGKSRDVLDARVLDAGVVPGGPPVLAFGIVEVRYGLQSHDLYHLPLGFRPADEGWNRSVIAEPDGWTVYDAIDDPQLVREIVGLMGTSATLRLEKAAIVFWGAETLTEQTGELGEVRAMGVEQSNSSVVIDETLALKLYRRIEPGVNPELELLRFLTDRGFEHIAALEGYAAYEGRPLETTLAILQRYVPAHGDGWELALDTIVEDPGDGDAHPVGAVAELVAELVDGLLQLEHGQEPLDRLLPRRQQGRVHGSHVPLEIGRAAVVLPRLGRLGAALQLRGRGRVREGAQHAGDVAQGRALAASLGDAARRLALEVEDQPVLVLGPERLAEVVVAVRADHPADVPDVRQRTQVVAHLLAAARDRLEHVARGQGDRKSTRLNSSHSSPSRMPSSA